MSEEAKTKGEEASSEEEEGAGFQRYEFLDDDQMLRCFVFEVVTTHCQGLYEISELNLVYKWIREGYQEKPRSLRAV